MKKTEKLAIDGGRPAVPKRGRMRRLIGAAERKAAIAVIDRAIADGAAFDRYGGVEVDAYEKEFARWLGVKYATAVSSGTAAVHTALAALQLSPGSEVVCSPVTDPGAVMPVVWNQCIPVFADTARDSFNASPSGVAAAITRRTGAIVVGHIAGEPCRIAEICAIARAKCIPVIEDCAQSHGATYRGRKVGTFGLLAAFSMMSGKHHTSGGQGGMVATNDERLYWAAKRFADRGKPFGTTETSNVALGLNYRMTELEAAIGRVQLKRVGDIVASRRRLAARFARGLSRCTAFRLGTIPAGARSAYWFLRIGVDLRKLAADKVEIARALKAEGVPAAHTYTTLIHTQKWFVQRQTFGRSGLPWTLPRVRKIDYANCCPNAAQGLAEHMILAFHEDLSPAVVDGMARAFVKVERAYLR